MPNMPISYLNLSSSQNNPEEDADFRGSWDQEFMFLEYRSFPNPVNLTAVYNCFGELNLSSLERAFQEVVKNHELLRSRMIYADGGLSIGISSEVEGASKFDFSNISGSLLEKKCAAVIRLITRHRFQLESEQPVKVALIKIDKKRYMFCLSMDHMISDTYSLQLIVMDILDLYAKIERGIPEKLSYSPFQFRDFVATERRMLSGPILDGRLEYWKCQLLGGSPLALPVDVAVNYDERYSPFSEIEFSFGGDDYKSFCDICADCRVTIQIVVLSILVQSLATWCEASDVSFVLLRSTRDRSQLARTIGPLFSREVIRIKLLGTESFRDLLLKVRSTWVAAGKNRIPNHVGDFKGHNVWVNYIVSERKSDARQAKEGAATEKLRLEKVVVAQPKTVRLNTEQESLLQINFCDDGLSVSCNIRYQDRVFKSKSIERLIEIFVSNSNSACVSKC